ncbi:unnamed protein product, partial [Rotaria sp. Silwood2]
NTNDEKQFEKHFKLILEEIKNSDDLILFIDNLHLIFDNKKTTGIIDAENVLKLMLAEAKLHCIVAITFDKYEEHIKKDPVFKSHCEEVFIEEPSMTDCISILYGLINRFELNFNDSSLFMAAQLSNHYIRNGFLPAKAIHLINEACQNVRDNELHAINQLERQMLLELDVTPTALSQEIDETSKQVNEPIKLRNKTEKEYFYELELNKLRSQLEKHQFEITQAAQGTNFGLLVEENEERKERLLLIGVLRPNSIMEIVSRLTEISISNLITIEKDCVLKLNEYLHTKIVGQDDAIENVVNVLKNRTELLRQNQLIGYFLFLGPIGVGKSELTKALTLYLFHSIKSMIYLDMSDYTESNTIDQFIFIYLSDYAYSQQDNQLTKTVQQLPYATIFCLMELRKHI